MSASGDYTGCTGLSWSYDNWGNRTAQSVTGGSCPSAFTTTFSTNTNRMDGFAYDAAGDQQKDSSYCYAYDAEGRITTVYQLDCATFVASYVYDGLGRRIETNHGSWQMYFVYNIAGQPVDEWDQGGMGYTGWYRAYAYLGGHMVAQYQNNTTYFAMLDHLGSTHILTNYPTPTVYDSIDYTPYGDIFSGTSNTTHKFTGKERDTETNLDYFGARYFSSVQGRFLTPDWDAKPVTVPYAHFGNPQSLNLYAYVGNNPITLADPDGHAADPPAPNAGCGTITCSNEAAKEASEPPGQRTQKPAQNQQTYGRQPDGSYKADPAKVQAAIDDKTPIGNGQCVAACSRLSGVTPHTDSWTPGKSVLELNDTTDVGLAIATFGPDGNFKQPGTDQNSSIYMGHDPKTGQIVVVDQFPPPNAKQYNAPFKHLLQNHGEGHNLQNNRMENNAFYYHVIVVR